MKRGFLHNLKNGVSFLSIPSFDETGLCTTCFSTRLGGVSKPPIDSMNLGFGRGDERESVIENYRRLGEAAGFDGMRVVAFTQVHGCNVCVATEDDAGEALTDKKREFDAVVTNAPNLPIATYHADCVPVFLLDPIKRAVGVAHAGWRGTALKCPAEAVKKMTKVFGSDPRDILAAVGPAIDICCFETDRDVPDAMLKSFGEAARAYIKDVGNGKFFVSLTGLCTLALSECGIPDDNITVSGECTCCKSDLFWSHRATGGVRGAMAAIISLKGGSAK